MINRKLLISSLLTFFFAFFLFSLQTYSKEIIMGGEGYDFIFEDKIILGYPSPTSNLRLIVNGGAKFNSPISIASPSLNSEAVNKSYVDPYLAFIKNANNDIHNTEGRVGINMNILDTPNAHLEIKAATSTEGLRIVSSSDYSPLNIQNSAGVDIFRVDQTGSLATGSIPWEKVTNVPSNFGSNWSNSGNDIYRLDGKVGVGTSNPTSTFEIFNSSSSHALTLSANDANIRPNIRQIALRPNASGIAYNMFEGYIGNTITNLTKAGVIGVLGKVVLSPAVSTVSYMYFGAETNTAYNNNTFRLYPNKSAYFDGNVGIGTTAPRARLQVAGSAISGVIPPSGTSGDSTSLIVSNSDIAYGLLMGTLKHGNSWIQSQRTSGAATAYNLLLQPNGGNVGINTSTPSTARLVVDDETGVAIDVAGGLIAGLGDPTDEDHAVSKLYADSNFLKVDAFIASSYWQLNGNNLFASSSDWNVGIGTNSPGAKLQIEDASAPTLLLKSSTLNSVNSGYLGLLEGDSTYGAFLTYDGSANKLHIGTRNVGTDANRITIVRDTGKVGINTTTPTSALLVLDDGTNVVLDTAGGIIRGLPDVPSFDDAAISKHYADTNFIPSTTAGTIAGAFVQGGNSFGATATLGTLDNNNLEFLTNSNVRLTILADGKVGIGEAGPVSSLEVAGDIRVGNTEAVCNAANSGAIKHNPANNQSYVCDGVRWLNQRNCGTVTDADGNTYGTVVIGGQCWMDENINVGTRVGGANNQGTSCLNIEKYCFKNLETNCDVNGGLYQWDQAMCGSSVPGAQGICPSGWHIPTDAEWNILEKTVMQLEGGTSGCNLTTQDWQCPPAGTALKAIGQGTGTDKVGFKGLLSGNRYTNSNFGSLSSVGYYWSSTPSGPNAWGRGLVSSSSTIFRYLDIRQSGFSLRCLKD